jgi:hypothetical protein
MNADLRFSRLTASAKDLAGDGFEPQRFVEQPVLLTGTAEVLASENGAEIARCALLLLIRATKSLTVALPAGLDALADELEALAKEHAWDEVPRIVHELIDPTPFASVLSVGGSPKGSVPQTIITSNGWSVRITSGPTQIPQTCQIYNPVGALAAASLGVGEVFKRLLMLRDDRGQMLDGCIFSLWTYAPDADPGPTLPTMLDVDLLLAGAGAIGNGVAHLLTRLPLRGRVAILDRQTYGEENWGTCLRLTRRGVKEPKAAFLAGLFTGSLIADPLQGHVELLERDQTWKTPPVVLNGFDNVEARHAVQDLWPDLVIDGAIGRLLECQVSAHPWPSPVACLRCIFRSPPGERAENVQKRMTGLAANALANQTRPLSNADLAEAIPERREWLAGYLGKPICSVLEAAASLSDVEQDEGFRPSVPFVATFSACMMVAELVRYLTTGSVAVEPRFFFSLLWGPQGGEHYQEDRRASCLCVQRAANIERVRAARTKSVERSAGVAATAD